MKKFKVFGLLMLILFSGFFFSACKKGGDILCESITLSENEITLMIGETVEIDVEITPKNATKKEFEVVGNYADVARIECDYDNMKLIITARDFITADLTDAIIGVRTVDGSEKEAHLEINLVEENLSVATPQNLTFDGNSIVWRAVDNANGYTLSINENTYIIYQNSFALDLDEFAGQTVTAKVKANGRSSNLDSSYTSDLSFYVLQRPVGIEYNDDTQSIFWRQVENANSYVVYINNRPFLTISNNFTISDYLPDAGQYEIRVRANGNADGSVINSAFSNSVILTKLSAPQDISIQNGIVIWQSVVGAIAYDVEYQCSKDGNIETKVERVNSVKFTLPTNLDAGSYSFKIKAIGNGRTTITGDYGVLRYYSKLEKVQNLRIENGDVVWDANNMATSYTIYFENLVTEDGNNITDTVFQTSGLTTLRYNISNYPAGEYKIDIVANGLNDKVSSDKTGNPINVIKLASPKNLQVRKENGRSIVQWDSNSNASAYKILINNNELNEISVPANSAEKITYTFGADVLIVGSNEIRVKAIGNVQKDGVWYINSEYCDSFIVIKLGNPTINMNNILDGNISWTQSYSQGFESYTIKIVTSSGNLVYEDDVTKNTLNLNNTQADSFNLPEGDYKIQVKTNAKENSNYYNSDYSTEVLIHKFGVETLSVSNGTIEDLISDNEQNYKYRYFVSKNNSPIMSIKNYVNQVIVSGEKLSIVAQKLPNQIYYNGVYYVPSNYSNRLYVQKLPTISNLTMINGILYYGSEYEKLSGYKFLINLNDNEIDNGTHTTYDFSNFDAGEYSIKIKAISVQEGDGIESDDQYPLNLNSYDMTNAFSFKKLNAPVNLRIESYAANTEQSLETLITDLTRYNSTISGVIKWNSVASATEYELSFDDGSKKITTLNTYLSLQNIDLSAGIHTVSIKSIGNNENIISSEYAQDENNETIKLSFTKLVNPSNLYIEDGKIKWEYSNTNDDPNNNLIINLFSPTSKISTYVLVDSYGNFYDVLGLNDVDISDGIIEFVNRLSANECDIPKGLNGTATLSIFAVPLNAYLTNITNLTAKATNENSRYVTSNYSPSLNLVVLETPLNLHIENKKLSWSGLRYNLDENNNQKPQNQKPLAGYRVTIKNSEDTYQFTVKEDPTKTYEIDSANKTIWIGDLSSNNCYWYFTKENFENFFGENSYISGMYSIYITALANNTTYFDGNGNPYNVTYADDSGVKYHYCNSYDSTAIKVEVLENPTLYVKDGVVNWNAIQNVSSYKLFINTESKGANFIELSGQTTNFELGSNYSAGAYYFNIQSIGNEISTLTAEFDENKEKEFIKLDSIAQIYVANGVVVYDENVANSGYNYIYTMFIKPNQSNAVEEQYSNDLNTLFELGDNFDGGLQYYIRVRVSGDDDKYLNSDLSNYCYTSNEKLPTKLDSPQRVYVSNGKLTWTSVPYSSYYRINLSGQTNVINTINTYFDISYISSGTYLAAVKAIGDSDYLNSTPTENSQIVKLSNISNLTFSDGYLSWDYESASNYRVVVNDVEIEITNQNTKIENGKVKYNLSGFDAGNYAVYVYNYGGENKISSAKTETLSLTKLSAPTNLTIENEVLKFDAVENSTGYFIEVNGIIIDDFVSNTVPVSSFLTSDSDIYEIRVMAIGSRDGDNKFISSEYSNVLIVTSPDAPIITAVETSKNKFSGKITWDTVENADYYKVYVKYYTKSVDELGNIEYSFDKTTSIAKAVLYDYEQILSEDNEYEDYSVYKVNDTYCNIVYNGVYDIFVVAYQNINGYKSENSNIILKAEFNLFNENNDGNINPYQITDIDQFNIMQYNKNAKYVLINDLVIAGDELEMIGQSDNMFNGEFDGNEKNITLNISSNNKNIASLIGYIGENGIIQNFNLICNIYSIKQTNNSIYVAGVAEFNYGTIKNIVVSGEISTEYNYESTTIYNAGVVAMNYGKVSYVQSKASVLPKNNSNMVYAGGIATVNYGIIEKSGFVGKANAQFVGGIASQNLNGTITECYYEANSNLETQITSANNGSGNNYAGGIVGYMQGGKISYCYVNGVVSGASNTTNSNVRAYVGGIVGFAENSSSAIQNSYVIGCLNSSTPQITASGMYVYAGVFVGDNNIDSSNGNLYCIKTQTQTLIGNTNRYFDNAQTVSNLNVNRLGSDYFEENGANYPKLKNANYN